MQELERLKGENSVADNIMKADRNFTKLKIEMESVDVSDDIQNHNTEEFAHPHIQQEIADLTAQSNDIATDVTSLKTNALQYKTNPSTNANDFIEPGLYKIPSAMTNILKLDKMPTNNSTEGELKVFRWGIGYFTQRFTSIYGGTIEREYYDSEWKPWRQLATTEKVEIINFLNGWKVGNASYSTSVCRVGGAVTVSLLVKADTPNSDIIAILPHKPRKAQILKAVSFPAGLLVIDLRTDGSISTVGIPPAHEWISIVDTYNL